MSCSHQPISTYPLNFNSDIKVVSATLMNSAWDTIYIVFCILYMLSESVKSVKKENIYSLRYSILFNKTCCSVLGESAF